MTFEDKLRQALDGLDIEQADMLLRGTELPRDSSAGRILRRISKRERGHIRGIRRTAVLAVIIALAAVTVVTAGAAYVLSAHKESIDEQFGSGAGETFESRGLLDGSVFDSEHYTLTVDTVLCTGEQLAAVITLEPKDAETLEHIKLLPLLGISGRNYDAFASQLSVQGCALSGGGYSSGFDNNDNPTKLLFFLNSDCSCAKGKSYTANLKISELCLLAVDGGVGYGSRDDDELEKKALGEVTLTFEKNIDYRHFESDDGTELLLCDIGFRCGAYHDLHAFTDEPSFTFEYRDGSTSTFTGNDIDNFSFSGMGRFGGSYTKAGFARLKDTSDVTAVIIEGYRYEEAGE